MRLISLVLLKFIFLSLTSHAQYANLKSQDPYGFVTKYDSTFHGIGPEVYILPTPRTLADEMVDTYKELVSFQDSIHQGFQYENAFTAFKKTTNATNVYRDIPDTLADGEFERIIQNHVTQSNHAVVYCLYNDLALDYLYQKKKKHAIEALQTALIHAKNSNSNEDIAIIQSNLASAYILTNQYEEALKSEKEYLQYALDTKNLADQATSQTRIALIQAYSKDYKTAENTIIRKSIPLFNKSKFYEGKIDAWITLAEIYRTQNKHTEAQWFLIQARDLAKQIMAEDKIPMIEYMLGSSKLIQKNYKVATQELEKAWSLAQDGSNKYLQLAIVEQLGRTYVNLKDYDAAKNYLTHYWELRNLIF